MAMLRVWKFAVCYFINYKKPESNIRIYLINCYVKSLELCCLLFYYLTITNRNLILGFINLICMLDFLFI